MTEPGPGGAGEPVGPLDARRFARFAGIRTFARLPLIGDVGRADVAVLGAPFDRTATYRAGARFGPAAIREASLLLRPYNEPLDLEPFAAAQVADAGDSGPSPVSLEDAHGAIEDAAAQLHRSGARVLALGGDHSVALPLMRAAAAAHGRLSLLQLDAHTDTWDEYFGQKVGHGTIMRRAAEDGTIDARSSAQLGLRGPMYARSDYESNRELGFSTVLAREFDVDAALELARRTLRSPVYVSVDIDVLDPAFAPGTGTPEPGGLSTRELLAVLRGLAEANLDVVGADVVEVSPAYDHAQVTALAAAAAAYDLIGLMVLSRGSAPRR
ncbi:MAG: agmatinase [Solirubrobacteraceae bacterium]